MLFCLLCHFYAGQFEFAHCPMIYLMWNQKQAGANNEAPVWCLPIPSNDTAVNYCRHTRARDRNKGNNANAHKKLPNDSFVRTIYCSFSFIIGRHTYVLYICTIFFLWAMNIITVSYCKGFFHYIHICNLMHAAFFSLLNKKCIASCWKFTHTT